MLENLSTEKNALVYQLERLEQQLKTVQGASANGSSINMAGIDHSEGKMRNELLNVYPKELESLTQCSTTFSSLR